MNYVKSKDGEWWNLDHFRVVRVEPRLYPGELPPPDPFPDQFYVTAYGERLGQEATLAGPMPRADANDLLEKMLTGREGGDVVISWFADRITKTSGGAAG